MREDDESGRRGRWNGEETGCQFPVDLDFVRFDVCGRDNDGGRR